MCVSNASLADRRDHRTFRGGYGDPCLVSQAKPVNGEWRQCLGDYGSSLATLACQLRIADCQLR